MSGQSKSINYESQNIHSLIEKLLRIWSLNLVEQQYQNYYLAYLDTLLPKEVQISVAKEIQLTIERKSYYFLIKNAIQEHDKIINNLKRVIGLCSDKIIKQSDLSVVCQILTQLRATNLIIAQLTLKFNRQCLTKKPSNFLICGNNHIFHKINEDNQFLKTTFLQKYLYFTNSYDPFFLYHFQASKKDRYNTITKKQFSWVINEDISSTYKLMKAQQQILSYLSDKIPNSGTTGTNLKNKRYNYHLIEGKSFKQLQQEEISLLKFNKNYRKQSQVNIFREQSQEMPHFQRSKTEGPYLLKLARQKQNDSNYNSSQLGLIKNQKYLLKGSKKQKYYLPPIHNNNNSFAQQKKYLIDDKSFTNNSSFIDTQRQFIPRLNNKRYYTSMHNVDEKDSMNQQPKNIFLLPNQDNIGQIHGRQDQNSSLHKQNTRVLNNEIYNYSFKNNYQLKASSLDLKNIILFLKEANIKPQYKIPFLNTNWSQALKTYQYYMLKFYLNDKIEAIALCLATARGQIAIKYWGPFTTCSEENSNFLFEKCLKYIQKRTPFKIIYYNGPSQIQQLFKTNFIRDKQKERVFFRQRMLPRQIQLNDYSPFLSISFSSISFSSKIDKQLLSNITRRQLRVDEMDQQSFLCVNYLLIVNKLLNPGIFSQIGTYTGNYKSLSEVETKLIKEEIFSNPYNIEYKINNINLLTFKLVTPLKYSLFLANHPKLKLEGDLIYNSGSVLIVCVDMNQYNSKLYFCKGEQSMIALNKIIKQNNSKANRQKMSFVVNMFRKKLRGRISSINLRDEYCFGDCSIKFEWKDYLQGRIHQQFDQYQLFGGSDFNCLLQVDKELIFGFQITKQNLL